MKPWKSTWKCFDFQMLQLGALQASTLRCFRCQIHSGDFWGPTSGCRFQFHYSQIQSGDRFPCKHAPAGFELDPWFKNIRGVPYFSDRFDKWLPHINLRMLSHGFFHVNFRGYLLLSRESSRAGEKHWGLELGVATAQWKPSSPQVELNKRYEISTTKYSK